MSPRAGDFSRSRGGMLPRVQSAPEHNIIQNPSITRGIARFGGLKQAHVSPALTEGITPTLITGDVREDPRTSRPESFAVFYELVPDGVNVKRVVFGNPYGSNRIAVLRRLHVYGAEDWIAFPTPAQSIVYDFIPLGATVFAPFKQGSRLVSGYTQVGGASFPPDAGFDVVFPPQVSACGVKNVAPNGIAGGYIWRGTIGGIGSGTSSEVLENFDPLFGPRIMIYPGGTFEVYALDTTFHAYFNFWWDEYPIS